jgi:hypothetical protein
VAEPAEVFSLLTRIDDGWAKLWDRVERLSADELLTSGGKLDGWPLSIVLAHIGRWEEWHRDAIEKHLVDGSAKSYDGYDSWNEEWAGQDRALVPSEARRRMQDTHHEFRRLLGELRPEQWDDVVTRWTQTCTYAHYEEHIGDFAPPA